MGYWVRLSSVTVLAALTLACSTSERGGDSSAIPVDYDIADVRILSQEMGAYTSSLNEKSVDDGCRSDLTADFRRRYYSPWSRDVSITHMGRAVTIMKEHLNSEWYGENKRRVPKNFLDELSANCDLAHLPSSSRPAVAINATDLRVLPTMKPFFERAEGFPFDALQNAALKLNEPIRVRHVTRDGIWFFVETADTNGWVPARDIGFLNNGTAREWMGKEQVVIVRDSTLIREEGGTHRQKANVGTICPLVAEHEDSYVILIAADSGEGNARVMHASVPKTSSGRFPLRADRESVRLVGNELIGKPYGWGEKYQDRDCSAMMRDFFIPFGIWLPRGSYNQINSGPKISLAGLGNAEKEKKIRERGEPFFTLVYLKGHIMLYVGEYGGTPLVFHNIWGVNLKDEKGREFKHVIGGSIVSTLNPGGELKLSSGSILERVSSMANLSDRCVGNNRGGPRP